MSTLGATFGFIFLGQIAPRVLIRSDLERFFGAEGPVFQYTGNAHVFTRSGYCAGGPQALICTAVRIIDIENLGNAQAEPPPGCGFPYTATAQVYGWFGIPLHTVDIDCNLGTNLVGTRRNRKPHPRG
jgi:hypothetical protein